MSEQLPGRLAIAGEEIGAGNGVWLRGGKVYSSETQAGWPLDHDGERVGDAVESIREGFRVHIQAGEVREDDA